MGHDPIDEFPRFVEVGPGKRVTGLVSSILGDRDHAAVALDASNGKRSGIADLAMALCFIAGLSCQSRQQA